MQNEYLKQVIRRNANHASPDPSDPQVDSWTALSKMAFAFTVSGPASIERIVSEQKESVSQ